MSRYINGQAMPYLKTEAIQAQSANVNIVSGATDSSLAFRQSLGADIYDSDRFATAAFAMGREGIGFIENLIGFEGYMIDKDGIGTETSGFRKYIRPPS